VPRGVVIMRYMNGKTAKYLSIPGTDFGTTNSDILLDKCTCHNSDKTLGRLCCLEPQSVATTVSQ
jgi:hypothetical protein